MAQTHSTDLEKDSSQYWSITDASQTGLGLTGNFTFEAWVKPESLATNGAIITKSQGTGGYNFIIASTGALQLVIRNGAAYRQFETAGSVVTTGSWQHIAVTCNVSAGTATARVDGSNISFPTVDGSATAMTTNAIDVRVGVSHSGAALEFYYDGLLDDVRVWNDIRTDAEIDDNQDNCNLSSSEAGLVAWWAFNNDGLDETSNNNDLTNNNSATFSTGVPYSCVVASTSDFFQLF